LRWRNTYGCTLIWQANWEERALQIRHQIPLIDQAQWRLRTKLRRSKQIHAYFQSFSMEMPIRQALRLVTVMQISRHSAESSRCTQVTQL
jgi:hypothetical protein